MWDSDTLLEVMTSCIILLKMIMEDEREGATNTNDFEKPRVLVHLLEQDAEHLLTFLKCIDKFEINKRMCNYSTIMWSICGSTLEINEFYVCTPNNLYYLFVTLHNFIVHSK